MRIALNQVNTFLIYGLVNSGVVAEITDNGGDIVLLNLNSGQRVAIHLVERDIDVGLIKDTLERNARAGYYTLFILSCAMLLPEQGELYLPYDWMAALMALYGDRIYGWEMSGSRVYIFPVQFEREPVGLKYHVTYGDAVDMSRLGCDTIHTTTQHLTGIWRIADFAGVAARHSRGESGAAPGENGDHGPHRTLDPNRNPIRVYYEILGVESTADWETIRRAYRLLARQFHPDVNKTPEAHERMQQINTAYTELGRHFGQEATS